MANSNAHTCAAAPTINISTLCTPHPLRPQAARLASRPLTFTLSPSGGISAVRFAAAEPSDVRAQKRSLLDQLHVLLPEVRVAWRG